MNPDTLTALGPATVPRSFMVDLCSKAGRSYRIRIGLPHEARADYELMVQGRKPAVVFMLDGDEQFGLVTDATRLMQWGGDVPPCLTVGIGFPSEDIIDHGRRRRHELTPTVRRDSSDPGPDDGPSGGGPDLLDFLADELRPWLDARFDTDPRASVLAGLSFGGLFTLYALTERPGLFTHHVAVSPSLWWDQSVIAGRLRDLIERQGTLAGRLYVAAGERERTIAPDIARRIRMCGHVEDLASQLALRPERFDAACAEILTDESHHSILPLGVTRGLRFVFSDIKG